MKTLLFGILFLVAAAMVAAIVVGAALKIVIFFVVSTAIVAGLLYVAGKIYGPPPHLPDNPADFDHAKR